MELVQYILYLISFYYLHGNRSHWTPTTFLLFFSTSLGAYRNEVRPIIPLLDFVFQVFCIQPLLYYGACLTSNCLLLWDHQINTCLGGDVLNIFLPFTILTHITISSDAHSRKLNYLFCKFYFEYSRHTPTLKSP